MIETTAALLGGIVAFFVGCGLCERYPNWLGTIASLLLACGAGGISTVAMAFGGGWLVDQSLVLLFDYRLDILHWVGRVFGFGVWGTLIGAAIGVVSGRRRSSARRDALAELARMRDFPRADPN
jgi:hypothetical protein